MLEDRHLETYYNIYYAGIDNNFKQFKRLFKFYLKEEVASGDSIKYFYDVVSYLEKDDIADNKNANNLQEFSIHSAMITSDGDITLQDIDDTSTYNGYFYENDDGYKEIQMVGTESRQVNQMKELM